MIRLKYFHILDKRGREEVRGVRGGAPERDVNNKQTRCVLGIYHRCLDTRVISTMRGARYVHGLKILRGSKAATDSSAHSGIDDFGGSYMRVKTTLSYNSSLTSILSYSIIPSPTINTPITVLRRRLHSSVCEPLLPPTAFPRGFFARAWPCLSCNGQCRRSARSAPHTPPRGGDVGVYDRISAKSYPVGEVFIIACLVLITGGAFSRNSYGYVVSDVRFPRTVGFLAGGAIVRVCAGSRQLMRQDSSPPLGKYIPPERRVDGV